MAYLGKSRHSRDTSSKQVWRKLYLSTIDHLTNITVSAFTPVAHNHRRLFVLIAKTYIYVVGEKNDDPYNFSKRLENVSPFSIEVEKRAPCYKYIFMTSCEFQTELALNKWIDQN